jgi:hypothetical protein
MNMKRFLTILTALFGPAVLLFVFFGEFDTLYRLTLEDGIFESATALFYAVGMIVAALAVFRRQKKLLPVVWAVLCLFFLGEETSWFQRQLNFSVPSVEEINVQGEFNLHNLNVFHGGKLTESSRG